MNLRIEPRRLRGSIEAIASKSHVHRLMIAGYLAGGAPLVIPNMSKDMMATAACLEALAQPGVPELDCNESGSTARFLVPVAAALKEESYFTGKGRLPGRPFEDLCVAMEAHGVTFDSHRLPMTIRGKMTSGEYKIPGNVSSQYISGLLFALPLLEGKSTIALTTPLESRGYVDMTLQVLRTHGIEVIETGSGYTVPGGQKYILPENIQPEGDWSNAAFWLAAGVKVQGLSAGSTQGDKAIVNMIKDSKLPGDMVIDVGDIPDLVPIAAVIGAARKGKTLIANAARLRIKESDRIHSVCQMIQNLGGIAVESPDSLLIEGTGSLTGGTVDSCNDHRIAMATAIASIICERPVYLSDAQAVEKSYPDFFQDFVKLGGEIHVI